MVGETISHFRVLRKIGQGGMGVVYEAEDLQLGRTVALKFLTPQAAQDEESKRRFLREAKTAASLDHPNVCGVYEIGESDGQPFFSMAFIEGQSVRDKIAARPLPLEEALDVALQAGQGLAAAHAKGIIHRDVKSANLMVTPEGQVKVMDFGLARAVEGSKFTKTGTLLGTVAYMSPEQAQRQPVDRRSDIWSFGVVLYEMVTGRLPFEGEGEYPVLLSIIHQDYEPVTALRVGVPTELDRILAKAMAKNPAERYQHIEDMLVDLRALRAGTNKPVRPPFPGRFTRRSAGWALTGLLIVIGGLALGLNVDRVRDGLFGGGGPKIDSIAIMPLQNLSGDPEQKYFSDGMTEALYTDLAKISALKVISPRAAERYEGTNATIQQIATELGVDAMVLGSAMRTGDQVRITAQLIDAETDTNLWAESFERDFADAPALQSELAQAIARQVRAQLTPAEAVRLGSARTVSPEAYEAYLKGKFFERQLTKEGLDTAQWYYESALEKDSNYAQAYAGVAFVWVARQQMAFVSPSEASAKARAAVTRALELDNTLAEVQYMLATFRFSTDWDWEGAEAGYRRAIELNPNYPDAHAVYAHLLLCLGRDSEAVEQIDRALEVDPYHSLWQAFRGMVLFYLRRNDEAVEQFQNVVRTDPNLLLANAGLWYSLHEKGMDGEAVAAVAKAFEGANHPDVAEILRRGYEQGGYASAMSLAAETLAEKFQTSYPAPPTDVAHMYLYAGERDKAVEWLEKGFDLRDPNMTYIGANPAYDPLRDDPRFQDLLRRMKLPQYLAVSSGN